MFILKLLSKQWKRLVVLYILKDIQSSSNDTIDETFAIRITELIAKSNGNAISTFLVRQ